MKNVSIGRIASSALLLASISLPSLAQAQGKSSDATAPQTAEIGRAHV